MSQTNIGPTSQIFAQYKANVEAPLGQAPKNSLESSPSPSGTLGINETPSLERTPSADTVDASIKAPADKKPLKLLAGIAAAAAIAGGIIYAVKSKKAREGLKEAEKAANKLLNEAQEAKTRVCELRTEGENLIETAQNKIDDVLALFKKGDEVKDGVTLRRVTDNVMEEFAEDGVTLIRRSEKYYSEARSIESLGIIDFLEDGKRNFTYAENGKTALYQGGIEFKSGEFVKCNDMLLFDNNYNPLAYTKNNKFVSSNCKDPLDLEILKDKIEGKFGYNPSADFEGLNYVQTFDESVTLGGENSAYKKGFFAEINENQQKMVWETTYDENPNSYVLDKNVNAKPHVWLNKDGVLTSGYMLTPDEGIVIASNEDKMLYTKFSQDGLSKSNFLFKDGKWIKE